MSFWLAWLVLTTPLPLSERLPTAAASSPRPAECVPVGTRRGRPSIWARAREPALGPYCETLAVGHARLSSDPTAALEAAEAAEALLPGRSGSVVLAARARLALGEIEVAREAFARAEQLDPRSLWDPATLRDQMRVLALSGERKAALRVARQLAPQARLLPAQQAVDLLVDAALSSTALAETASERATGEPSEAGEDVVGPAVSARFALAEARAFVAEALRYPLSPGAADARLVLALCSVRLDQHDLASSERDEALRAGASASRVASRGFPTEADAAALEALFLEASSPDAARAAWQRSVDLAPASPFAGSARARIARLSTAPERRPPR